MRLSCLALRPSGTELPVGGEAEMSQVDGVAGSVNTSKHTHANTRPTLPPPHGNQAERRAAPEVSSGQTAKTGEEGEPES